MTQKQNVQSGDLFMKAGTPPSKWIVDRMLDFPNMPPHVRLIQYDNRRRTITVALSTLLDSAHFRRWQEEQ